MGVSYYPVLDPPIEGFTPHLEVSGKAIARAMPLLKGWAAELGVRDLMSFYSESHAESFALIGESVPKGMKETPIEWFAPQDGLTALRAYLGRLRDTSAEELQFSQKGRSSSVGVAQLIED